MTELPFWRHNSSDDLEYRSVLVGFLFIHAQPQGKRAAISDGNNNTRCASWVLNAIVHFNFDQVDVVSPFEAPLNRCIF